MLKVFEARLDSKQIKTKSFYFFYFEKLPFFGSNRLSLKLKNLETVEERKHQQQREKVLLLSMCILHA